MVDQEPRSMFRFEEFNAIFGNVSQENKLSDIDSVILSKGNFQHIIATIDLIKKKSLVADGVIISCRIIEFFVSRYMNEPAYFVLNGLIVPEGTPGSSRVKIADSHEKEMSIYTKDRFDVFARGKFVVYNGKKVHVKQYNYFRWMLENGVLERLKQNANRVSTMKICYGSSYMNKKRKMNDK